MPGSRRRRSRARGLVLAAIVAALWAAAPPARAQTASRAGEEIRLEQNVPNPFTPGVSPTIFTFTLPEESRVRLTVYNLLAQEVAVLADETMASGTHRLTWDGIDAHDQAVPAGVYWYKLQAGEMRPLLRRLRVRDASAPAE